MIWIRRLQLCTRSCFAAAGFVLCGAAATNAATQEIYRGMTADQLVAFAKGEGWSAQIMARGKVIEIRAEDFSALIELFECDGGLRCGSGVIRTISYQFIEPDRDGFWHWNLANHGATGFGPSYITLQRYIHFNGVTNLYLRDVIGRIWPNASRSFWREVGDHPQSK